MGPLRAFRPLWYVCRWPAIEHKYRWENSADTQRKKQRICPLSSILQKQQNLPLLPKTHFQCSYYYGSTTQNTYTFFDQFWFHFCLFCWKFWSRCCVFLKVEEDLEWNSCFSCIFCFNNYADDLGTLLPKHWSSWYFILGCCLMLKHYSKQNMA